MSINATKNCTLGYLIENFSKDGFKKNLTFKNAYAY